MGSVRRYDFRRQHYAGEEGRLIPLLQRAQAEDGLLRRERLLDLQEETGIPIALIYGVATFYAQFRFTAVGRHLLRVCDGTACHVAGSAELNEAVREKLGVGSGETTPDGRFTVETVSCLGCCSLAPVAMIGETTYGSLTPTSLAKILGKHR